MPEDLRILARSEPADSKANDRAVLTSAIAGAGFGVAFAVVLRAGGPVGAYGFLLALALFSLGFSVRRYFTGRFPEVEAAQERDPRGGAEPATASAGSSPSLARRPLLTRVLVGATSVFGVSLLGLIPSLGPRVGNRLRRTPWGDGVPLVTSDGERIRPQDVGPGGIQTAWPQGNIGFERAAVVVLRLSEPPEEPTNLDWVIEGAVVAYSKICTHAGCPVALFRERDDALFCPCHQSTFDVRRAATPIFGPAARSLPQLPLGVDREGYLVALGDFPSQAGPAFG